MKTGSLNGCLFFLLIRANKHVPRLKGHLQLQICNSAHKRFIICYNGIVSRRADETK